MSGGGRLELSDSDSGLICGYGFVPEQRGQRLRWPECTQAPGDAPEWFRWLHLNLAMQPARRWLTGEAGLPEAAVEAMLDVDPHYHVVVTPQGFLLTLHDVILGRTDGVREGTGLIAIWVDRHQMVSARRWPMLCTDRLRHSVERDFAPTSSIDLFIALFDQIVDTFRKRVVRLRAEIDQAEDDMLSEHAAGLRPRLGRLRREAVAMHRRIVPEYHAINQLAARLPTWVSETEQTFFRQVADEVGSLVSDIREAQERARVLQDEYAAKIAEETNWNLYVLSMVTVIMLPMTFLTGFFGMNTAHLPFIDPEGLGTWGSGGLIVLVGVVTVVLLRSTLWKRHRDR